MQETNRSLANRLGRVGVRFRRRVGTAVFDNFFRALAKLGDYHPGLDPERYGVEVVRDVPYYNTGREAHLLDVYRRRDLSGPRPVVLYIHGGGFRILSKKSHAGLALHFARRGFIAANINYRLAPKHRYPAAIEDACRAYTWLVENISAFGGDPSRIVVAGESAGANLATGVTVATCYERPEPWAAEVYDTGIVPQVSAPTCGMLQVTDAHRFARRKRLPSVLADHLIYVEQAYLPDERDLEVDMTMANPIVLLEEQEPDRPLPPFYSCVGTADPLLDDTRRLEKALKARGVPTRTDYLEGQPHAFHCVLWTPPARKVWRSKFDFLDEHLGG